jgi:ubiquinol-cytochrome c reductase iron-sulfur subunit
MSEADRDKRVDGGVDNGRRHFLVVATTVTGVAGAALTAVPFLASWKPSARAQALGAPVEADISKIESGAMIKINWRGQAIYIVRRSPEMRAKLASPELAARLRDPESKESEQPKYAQNIERSLNPEFLVLIGVCTHLGCAPMNRFQPGDADLGADWPGGFYCPCHGSKFDLAGRVFKDVPAPLNLKVPPYRFINEGLVQIGVDSEVT